MKGRIAFATFIGGFIAWAFVSSSWFFLKDPCALTKKFKNEEAVGSMLIQNSYYDGVYILPNICEQQWPDPPLFIFSTLKREGVKGSSPARYLYSILIQFVGAFLMSLIMQIIKDQTYLKRIISGFLIAVVASLVSIFIPDGIWWEFPINYLFFIGINLVIGWFLASIAITFVIARPLPPPKKKKENFVKK